MAVRIPPFWAADPEMWFAQVETQFALFNVKVDAKKFNYVAGNLDARYAAEVRGILTLPENGPGKTYTNLKSQLIGRPKNATPTRTQ